MAKVRPDDPNDKYEAVLISDVKKMVRNLVNRVPAADVAPVVHGRWIFGTANHREWMKCSECLVSQTPTGVFTYCPNFGASMDLEVMDNGQK